MGGGKPDVTPPLGLPHMQSWGRAMISKAEGKTLAPWMPGSFKRRNGRENICEWVVKIDKGATRKRGCHQTLEVGSVYRHNSGVQRMSAVRL